MRGDLFNPNGSPHSAFARWHRRGDEGVWWAVQSGDMWGTGTL